MNASKLYRIKPPRWEKDKFGESWYTVLGSYDYRFLPKHPTRKHYMEFHPTGDTYGYNTEQLESSIDTQEEVKRLAEMHYLGSIADDLEEVIGEKELEKIGREFEFLYSAAMVTILHVLENPNDDHSEFKRSINHHLKRMKNVLTSNGVPIRDYLNEIKLSE